jgi:hypothetical protein
MLESQVVSPIVAIDTPQASRWSFLDSLIPKNPNQVRTKRDEISPYAGMSEINHMDIGTLFHTEFGRVCEMVYKFPRNVNLHPGLSERWANAYGGRTDRMRSKIIEAAVSLVADIEEGTEGMMLVSELPLLASAKDRERTLAAVMNDPRRARRPLGEGQAPVVPLTLDILQTDAKKKVIGYSSQAKPDAVGFHGKTELAKRAIQKLKSFMYQDNQGTKRYVLSPDLLAAHKGILEEVMHLMLKGELDIHVIEIKTNSSVGESLVKRSDKHIYNEHADDIGFTLQVLMKVFQSVSPDTFKGADRKKRYDELLHATTVKIGVVDIPTISERNGRVSYRFPDQINSRLVTLSPEQVRTAYVNRLKTNREYFIRKTSAQTASSI